MLIETSVGSHGGYLSPEGDDWGIDISAVFVQLVALLLKREFDKYFWQIDDVV
jgi:hypothetical protein